jgi:tetratricopeptide (TPR) repeat protein
MRIADCGMKSSTDFGCSSQDFSRSSTDPYHLLNQIRNPQSKSSVMPPRALHFLLVIILGVVLPATLRGATQEALTSLFAQANSHYQSGDFVAAEQLYRQLVEKGADNGVLYYNLGNACFKQKKLGEAIYLWEKARRRLPGDPDIRENLELAYLLVVDRIEIPPDPLPLRWLDSAVHRLTISQDCWIVLVLFVLSNGLLAAYLLARSSRSAVRALISALATGIALAVFGCALAWKLYERSARQEGVVIEQKADVRGGPGGENITVFTVHEGILVRVRGETGGWYQVALPNGWSGWLQKSAVRVID